MPPALRDVAIIRRKLALGYSACALAGGLWGTGFYFGKIALAEMSSNHMVLWRFFFACIVLAPFAVTHHEHLTGKQWRTLLIASFLGIPVQFLLQFYGLSLTTVSHASLMVGTMPVILGVGATLFTRERLDRIGWLALIASTVGVALIVLGGTHNQEVGHGPTLLGDMLVVISLVIALGWVLLNKQAMETHSPTLVTSYGVLSGTAMLIPYVLFVSGPPPVHGVSLKAWGALAASGVLCTATTTLLWNWGMTQVPASQAGVLLNMEPLIGSLLGVFLLNEHLGPLAWLGGGMILTAAIALTTRSNTPLEDPAMI